MFFTDILFYRKPETVTIERYLRYFMLNIVNLGRGLYFILVYKKVRHEIAHGIKNFKMECVLMSVI